jgi:hypothetical protein
MTPVVAGAVFYQRGAVALRTRKAYATRGLQPALPYLIEIPPLLRLEEAAFWIVAARKPATSITELTNL